MSSSTAPPFELRSATPLKRKSRIVPLTIRIAVAVDRDALTARRIRAVDQVTTEVDPDVVGGHG
jgi:hypothetical protein